jgi:hypothetical protein
MKIILIALFLFPTSRTGSLLQDSCTTALQSNKYSYPSYSSCIHSRMRVICVPLFHDLIELSSFDAHSTLTHLQLHRLRGGGSVPEKERSNLRGPAPTANKSNRRPTLQSKIEYGIRAGKKLLNSAGRQLKRKWIGGSPMPRSKLHQVAKQRSKEPTSGPDEGRVPTEKVRSDTFPHF